MVYYRYRAVNRRIQHECDYRRKVETLEGAKAGGS